MRLKWRWRRLARDKRLLDKRLLHKRLLHKRPHPLITDSRSDQRALGAIRSGRYDYAIATWIPTWIPNEIPTWIPSGRVTRTSHQSMSASCSEVQSYATRTHPYAS